MIFSNEMHTYRSIDPPGWLQAIGARAHMNIRDYIAAPSRHRSVARPAQDADFRALTAATGYEPGPVLRAILGTENGGQARLGVLELPDRTQAVMTEFLSTQEIVDSWRVVSLREEGASHRIVFEAPQDLARFIASKGSIAVDGVSLTVNEVDGRRFGVNIIPHTWTETTFRRLAAGSRVNLEIDLLARYVARLREMEPSR